MGIRRKEGEDRYARVSFYTMRFAIEDYLLLTFYQREVACRENVAPQIAQFIHTVQGRGEMVTKL